MRTKLTRAVCTVCLLVGGLFGTGCWGVWTARDDGASTAQTRSVSEWVPNAALARQDTSPDYPNGRYVFLPGSDRLLVVSQITSWADRPRDDKEEEEFKKNPPPQIDRQMERVWITIPFDAQVDQPLKIEEIEEKFMAGYDQGTFDRGLFVKPCRLRGFVTLKEIRPSEVVVLLDMVVEPTARPSWRVNQLLTVPIAPEGIRAGKPTSDRVQRVGRSNVTVVPSTPVKQPSPVGAEGGVAAVSDPPQVAPAVVPEAPINPQLQDKEARLLGRWHGTTANFDLKYQFEADGRFTAATTPRNAEKKVPIISGGRYEVRGDTIVLRISQYQSAGRDLRSLLRNPTLVLQHAWDGDALTLSGDLEGGHGITRARLEKGQFDDLKAGVP